MLDGPYSVPIKTLLSHLALTTDPWNIGGPVFKAEIRCAIKTENFVSEPYGYWAPAKEKSRSWHIGRIAFLAVHPDPAPVDIEVIDDEMILLHDGHHRLRAALYRKDRVISVSYDGYVGSFHRIFPTARLLVPHSESHEENRIDSIPRSS